MLRAGSIGQLKGPFAASEDIFAKMDIPVGNKVRFGVCIDPDILMADPGLGININGQFINIGNSGIYEVDTPMLIESLYFPAGAPADTIIDFITYD